MDIIIGTDYLNDLQNQLVLLRVLNKIDVSNVCVCVCVCVVCVCVCV